MGRIGVVVILVVLRHLAKIHPDVLPVETRGGQIHHHAQLVIAGRVAIVWEILCHLCDLCLLGLIGLADTLNGVLRQRHLQTAHQHDS